MRNDDSWTASYMRAARARQVRTKPSWTDVKFIYYISLLQQTINSPPHTHHQPSVNVKEQTKKTKKWSEKINKNWNVFQLLDNIYVVYGRTRKKPNTFYMFVGYFKFISRNIVLYVRIRDDVRWNDRQTHCNCYCAAFVPIAPVAVEYYKLIRRLHLINMTVCCITIYILHICA